MSKASLLELHKPEEAIVIDLDQALTKCTLPGSISPITDYFTHTQALIARFVRPEFSTDAEALSLLLLGVVSAAEFYFRSILVQSLDVCPYAMKQAERVQVPLGSLAYYGTKTRSLGLSVFEHKSLAGSAEIKAELQRLLGISAPAASSVSAALSGFDTLCELRHAAIHTRGYVSSKAASDLGISMSSLHRICFSQSVVFDLAKLSHNAVRSFNRFVLESLLDRWIAKKYLTGSWRADKSKFSRLFLMFSYPTENPFGEDVTKAYKAIQPSIVARMNSDKDRQR
ncbi:hypothetical protein [Paraburkholderia domus]|uniref:hypothetical protein n=1 Tax=Paraburkholderia domus TaxID=2793075 RepID=UPI001B1F9204|nr:hypothetical protein [Paraburkholderia domus]CAE6887874.1 hypothetical protein R69749_07431 [Paraburkholderia domus]